MDLSLLQRRIFKDKAARWVMLVLTVLSLLLLIAIGIGLFFKSRLILSEHSLWELLSGSAWKPLSGEFGFLPFIVGTLFVTALSIAIALPISLLSAIFLTEYASSWVKRIVFPIFDILAGIPSVVYGVWGTLIIVPWIADKLGPRFVDYTSGYTVLASGIVLGIMILPILVSLLIEIFTIVPQDYREASASLGATKWQTCSKVILRKAMPGIVAAVVLSISKAFGETIAVLMVCGNYAAIPRSLFDPCYPLPALIANNYGEMLSLPLYESALMFAAFILFFIILVFNIISRWILRNIERSYKM
ncbi:phosphate ABC transporter permease PstC [Bacteroides sp. CAG:144]|nr:phosphate ABC transporter permease PstC [Bacteroides sp. CAG:144]